MFVDHLAVDESTGSAYALYAANGVPTEELCQFPLIHDDVPGLTPVDLSLDGAGEVDWERGFESAEQASHVLAIHSMLLRQSGLEPSERLKRRWSRAAGPGGDQ